MTSPRSCRRGALVLSVTMAVSLAFPSLPAAAPDLAKSFAASLDAPRRAEFEAFEAAQTFHEFKLDVYWREITNKRALRRAKRKRGETFAALDYARTFPPEYGGPALSPDLAKAWEDYRGKNAPDRPAAKPIPPLSESLAHAKTHYDFEPRRVPEREFKLLYAREALALGLSKEQVLRVYALETGGQGTADMQSGVNPITKQGKPISSAVGYAQLLHANSVDELDNHGDKFVARLRRMAAEPGVSPTRAGEIKHKIAALRRMIANARAVPGTWEAHVAYGNTPKGMGIHAINLDGDIGPWLQVKKLAGLRDMAAKAGLPELAGSQIELMNLAGPGTGLEMMQPEGLRAPTPNFFTRQAYGRNSVVRGRTSAELIAEMDKRMDFALSKPGAVEFAAAFDEALGERQAAR